MPRKNHTPPHTPMRTVSSCTPKRRFTSENEALKAAEYQMLLKMDLELSVYKCEQCRGWHLTRQARTK